MKNWQKLYPYTLAKPLLAAMEIASANDDKEMVRKIWELFVYYRKSENYEKTMALVRVNHR